jgi:hypothetical protein
MRAGSIMVSSAPSMSQITSGLSAWAQRSWIAEWVAVPRTSTATPLAAAIRAVSQRAERRVSNATTRASGSRRAMPTA